MNEWIADAVGVQVEDECRDGPDEEKQREPEGDRRNQSAAPQSPHVVSITRSASRVKASPKGSVAGMGSPLA
jgi:hypothetical protein